jgi:hypothetical protein
MAAPTPPFATTEQVALFMPSLINSASDFTESSTPKKSTVESVLALVSSQIEITFGQAGYLVPLTEIDGESWLSSQSSYLQLLTIMGTASMVGGNVLKPAPATTTARVGSGNVFKDFFDAELKKIPISRFRARYYIGTQAEKMLSEPMGPMSDYLEGYYDPTMYLSFENMTNKIRAIQLAQTDLAVNWDYLYGIFDQPLGYTVYELYESYL